MRKPFSDRVRGLSLGGIVESATIAGESDAKHVEIIPIPVMSSKIDLTYGMDCPSTHLKSNRIHCPLPTRPNRQLGRRWQSRHYLDHCRSWSKGMSELIAQSSDPWECVQSRRVVNDTLTRSRTFTVPRANCSSVPYGPHNDRCAELANLRKRGVRT